jgi:hypothetical protein
VATREHLKLGEALHCTAPAYTSVDGTVAWEESILIETRQLWEKFILTLDLHPIEESPWSLPQVLSVYDFLIHFIY